MHALILAAVLGQLPTLESLDLPTLELSSRATSTASKPAIEIYTAPSGKRWQRAYRSNDQWQPYLTSVVTRRGAEGGSLNQLPSVRETVRAAPYTPAVTRRSAPGRVRQAGTVATFCHR